MNGSMRASHLASDTLLGLSAPCHVGLCGVAKTSSDHESLPVPWLRYAKLEHTQAFSRDNSHQMAGLGVDDTAPVTSPKHDDVSRPESDGTVKMMEVVESSTEPRREPTHIVKTEAASAPSIKVEEPSGDPCVGSAGGPPAPQEEISGTSSTMGAPSLQVSGNADASAPAPEEEARPRATLNMPPAEVSYRDADLPDDVRDKAEWGFTLEVAVDDDKEAGAETALDAMIEDPNKAPKLAIIESCGLDSQGPDTRADSLPSEPQPQSDGDVAGSGSRTLQRRES
ncbi:hypothetical protein C8Q76DRAFT_690734 [Earliella scabrosa]|nr:hypothetical protein C8Q76DRAFT_690734 [Earliella scabrosa]